MLNESKRLRSNDHSEEWAIHEKEVHNGKVRCFICHKDSPEDLIEESDYQSIFIKSRTAFHNVYKLVNNSEEKFVSQGNANLMVKNANSLIQPCVCDKAAHPGCLLTYCLINITFECSNCKVKYAMKFSDMNNSCSSNSIGSFLLVAGAFFVHSALLIIAALLFAGKFEFATEHYFWEIILGVVLMLLNIFLILTITVSLLKTLMAKKVIPEFLHKSESEETRKITEKKGKILYNLLTSRHNCDELELLEKKRNNMIFLETIIKDEMKITQFISQNNTIFNLKQFTGAEEFLDPKTFSQRSALIKPTYKSEKQYLRKQKSYNLQNNISNSIKPPIPNPKGMLVKSKTKNSGDKTGDLNLLRKMHTTNKNRPKSVLNEMNDELHEIREEDPNRAGTMEKEKEHIIFNKTDTETEQENEFLTLKENLVPKEESKKNTSLEKYIHQVGHTQKFSEFEFEQINEIKNTANYVNCDVIIDKINSQKDS